LQIGRGSGGWLSYPTLMNLTFRYAIAYVPDARATVEWFARTFGFETRMVHESGAYAELETGSTILAFASESLGEGNFPGEFQRHRPDEAPLGTELVFTTEDVQGAVDAVVRGGGTEIAPPTTKPWNQVVAYVRDPNGLLIELATPLD